MTFLGYFFFIIPRFLVMISHFFKIIYLNILTVISAVNTGVIIIITVILICNNNISNSLNYIDKLYYSQKSFYS